MTKSIGNNIAQNHRLRAIHCYPRIAVAAIEARSHTPNVTDVERGGCDGLSWVRCTASQSKSVAALLTEEGAIPPPLAGVWAAHLHTAER